MRLVRIVTLLGIVCIPLSTMAPPHRPEIYGAALVRLHVTNLEVSRSFYASTLACRRAIKDALAARNCRLLFY